MATAPAHKHTGTTHARTAAELARPRPVPPAGGHPAVWAPWEAMAKRAAEAVKTEIAEALAELEAANASANRILEVAESAAAQASGQITAAAWAGWHKQMDEAGRVYDAIMDPARAAYEQATARAADRFNATLAAAKAGLDRELAAATSAQALASEMPTAS